ncbi:glycyl-radical enzyme activating protein [[Clostridium] innocuum]|uniref:glycyl-radical enzyme activating protein n=1 Tax=Bacillota TaxID=1239 RepID=UPI001EDCFF2A|nr:MULTISPECIES: glycyl-radical enzyme activating protein [Coprobacillaceae]MCG4663080.1 glycyl-radical enzyme activating protein [[Clostridium] innocuum]MCR0257522.1 glycyl-radical enzyme activating protein [[Clostridium] innocuum]MCR0442351.1 glycyl-radical enzyme activating protein [[Clostridium] innocuum]MEE1445909.1 glycyl-radical enzyme activating protein [Faecalibacillus intestinalis]
MNVKAKMMEIERFAIHDGPGVRTTIFLQGCPLQCPWCANPESQTTGEKLMYNKSKCILCGTCAENCPTKSIQFVNEEIVINRKTCINCKTCAKNCLVDAIYFIGKESTIDEIMAVIMKDKDYYDVSGGGITISGGEPFMQYNALCALLDACKEQGIHTAVETTGDTDWDKIEMIQNKIDLFLFDVKHINPEKIKEITKGNGNRILENLRKLAKIDASKIVIRVPVIPTFNNDEITIQGIISLAIELGIPEINLLPYHNLGKSKYDHLGLSYPMGNLAMMKKEELQKYYRNDIIHVKIGG